MTTPVTYPSGTISTWGINQALTNQNTWISYIGVDGSIFYLAGPAAPVVGAQDGLILQKHMGLMAPFQMLELRGARQDGATFTDAVYDVGEIMLGLEASGIGPQNIRDVMRHWIAAWDPKKTGILSVFTPDLGEWWANVRQAKNISDQFTQDYTWSGRQPLTWSAKNYDAYWYSVDSTSQFAIAYASASENFTTESNSATLNTANWTQILTPTGKGTCGIENGACVLIPNGSDANFVAQNIYKTGSDTDNQVVSVQLSGALFANLFAPLDPGATIDIWTRLSSDGTSGVKLELSMELFVLAAYHEGTQLWEIELPLIVPPLWGETFTLIAGTAASDYNYVVQRDGFTLLNITDSAQLSQVGSSYRDWGFGLGTSNILGDIITPFPLMKWTAADNLQATQSGFIPLTNIGDVEAWPRYLCYGPGTFTFNNGPGSGNPITFGPLEEGQVVLVTTEPRLSSVVDLTPNQPAQQLNTIQSLISELISFATNNNTPPLLQQFESLFGILPPQGNLYSLLNGRFTVPLPGATYGVQPVAEQIWVSITDGSPLSQVVAAITPRRRWPL